MKNKIKFILDFAKGVKSKQKMMRVFSVICGERHIMEKYSIDTPMGISIEVHADVEAQLEIQEK